jgi:quercetin dioxygenase-like cupin family protein
MGSKTEGGNMRKAKLTLAAAAMAAGLFGAWGIQTPGAQQPGFKRTPLQKQELTAHGREAVQVIAEFAPGVAAGKHTHPGEELGYVLEGSLQLEIQGKPPVTLKAGDSFFVPAGVVHDGKNVGKGPLKVLATYIVEKGKPVASPVK